jgi:lipopolysaccharide assembly outer membrane protein LptD (OstA)
VRAFAVGCLLIAIAVARPVAQQPPGDLDYSKGWRREKISEDHYKVIGAVEARRGEMTIFADEIEVWTDTHRALLTGNVTFQEKGVQISADRADVDYESHLGTFYDAYGFATLANRPKRDAMGGQEPDVYFYGATIDKVGFDKYKISHGGFTTCLQPTPRWQITSGSVTLRLEHYAFVRNALIRAKGVPVFYLPALFYPVKKDDRATGFLLPTYGTSTFRGFTLSNAFFWAINRSQDVTFLDDWFSKRGQGMGTEYRYVEGPGSSGNLYVYRLNEHESTEVDPTGATSTFPGRQSYEIRSTVNQALGHGWVARARVDYFSDITVQQSYNTDIYNASRSTRTYGGSIAGSLKGFTLNGAYDRTEYFSGTTDTTLTGGTPRFQFARGERPLFGTPIYFSMGGESVRLLRESRSGDTVTDRGLTRVDFQPTIRVPFTKLSFLSVNSSVSWRGTYWTRSQDPAGNNAEVDVPINRRYFDFQSRVTGPLLNRVWNTPNNGYAEKWKHTIEPFVNVERVTMVDNFDQIVQLDGTDSIVGGTTRVDYGVNTRLLAKRRTGGTASSAREVLSAGVTQTYYTDARASQYDYNYATSFNGRTPSNFSAIRFSLRGTPTDRVNGTMTMEYDKNAGGIQALSGHGQVAVREWLNLNVGYSQRLVTTPTTVGTGHVAVPRDASLAAAIAALGRPVPGKPFAVYTQDNSVNLAASVRTTGNRVGGNYTFNYDIGRSTLLNSRIIGYYNAQCCGFAIEYQTYNIPQLGAPTALTQDHRWNFSFTLAGLGTFSNFFGALGGAPR